MRPLELAFILVAFGLLIAQTVRGVSPSDRVGAAVAGLAILLASAALGQVRWQMAPAYLLFAVLSLLLLKRSSAHVAVRSLGAALGILLLASGAVASLGMPILKLPPPDGPHAVGSASFSLTDVTRNNAFFDRPDEPREIYVQLWYPGEITPAARTAPARSLWKELYRGRLDRFTVLSSYLRGIETHSYEDIPLSTDRRRYPAIVFSHAMVSFAEQNTLLMEHLASHGYLVFAVGHPYTSMRIESTRGAIYPDLDKVDEVSAQFRPVNRELTPLIARAGTPEDRMKLQLELYERATGNNALMAVWVADLGFVLDEIAAADSRVDSRWRTFADRVDTARIGFLGMSFGGGAVTELCKSDTRCRAALNIDGPTFGRRQRQPLEVPYLALVREDQNALDYLRAESRSDYYQLRVAGATHLDFTDDTVVLPILKWLKTTGAIDGWRAIEIVNGVSLRFFDAYLRGGSRPRFGDDLADVAVETNVGE